MTLSELFSKSQVYAVLHELLMNWNRIRTSLGKLINTSRDNTTIVLYFGVEFVCYDDACHLRRYACNPKRSDLNECTKFLSGIEIVVDKMHMTGHVDKWCKEHCNPSSFPELNAVCSLNSSLYFNDCIFYNIG